MSGQCPFVILGVDGITTVENMSRLISSFWALAVIELWPTCLTYGKDISVVCVARCGQIFTTPTVVLWILLRMPMNVRGVVCALRMQATIMVCLVLN